MQNKLLQTLLMAACLGLSIEGALGSCSDGDIEIGNYSSEDTCNQAAQSFNARKCFPCTDNQNLYCYCGQPGSVRHKVMR